MTKKIISFSLFGENAAYLDGALANCALSKSIYPDWTVRIYVSHRMNSEVVRQLAKAGAEVVIKKQTANFDGLLWRFLPASEEGLGALIVRDVDSRLGAREKSAVDEWILSGKRLHIIRDHPSHGRLILAGLWGCRGGVLPDISESISRFARNADLNVWDVDALFLERIVYPRFLGDMFVHSEYQFFTGETPMPVPLKRVGNEYLGFPPDRGNISVRRMSKFKERKNEKLVERPLPDWIRAVPKK